jgi:hypothetical protein
MITNFRDEASAQLRPDADDRSSLNVKMTDDFLNGVAIVPWGELFTRFREDNF